MFCTNCGTEVPDDSVFCPECGLNLGTQVVEENPIPQQPEQPAMDQPVYEQPVYEQQPMNQQPYMNPNPIPPRKDKKSSSNTPIIILCILIGVAIVVALGIFAYFVFFSKKNTESVNQSPIATETPLTQPTTAPATMEPVTPTTPEYTPEPYVDDSEEYVDDEEEDTTTSDDYIIPESSSKLLKKSDVKHLSKSKLRLARNEIYARHGRLFDDETLQDYFDSQDWYIGSIDPDDFSEDMLSKTERKNVSLISKYEAKK